MPETREGNLVNSEITEILSSPPRWLIRWGTTLVLLLIVVLLLSSYFITWPDTIASRGVLKMNDTSYAIRAESDFTFQSYIAGEKNIVDQSSPIAIVRDLNGHVDTLRAPVAGTLEMREIFHAGQEIQKGKLLFDVYAEDSTGEFYTFFDASAATKIKPGMNAVIEMAEYTPDVFGVIQGRVTSLPQRRGGYYFCTVKPIDGFHTSTGRSLPVRDSMQAQITITIAEPPLIRKFICAGL